MLTLANRLTILRILMTPVITVLLLYRQVGAALALFLLAGITDGLDGPFLEAEDDPGDGPGPDRG
ncbi:MAG: CDP-alcohol phosphatidyltransferase family protein [candidate division NC10 bacterium]|nr:CDP-alcohol phosphatidyltransferase family protein [candidate division NC10 bacterium]